MLKQNEKLDLLFVRLCCCFIPTLEWLWKKFTPLKNSHLLDRYLKIHIPLIICEMRLYLEVGWFWGFSSESSSGRHFPSPALEVSPESSAPSTFSCWQFLQIGSRHLPPVFPRRLWSFSAWHQPGWFPKKRLDGTASQWRRKKGFENPIFGCDIWTWL